MEELLHITAETWKCLMLLAWRRRSGSSECPVGVSFTLRTCIISRRCCWLIGVFRTVPIWIWLCLIFPEAAAELSVCLSNIWAWVCPGSFSRGKYSSEILFLMSCMWCNVELRTIDSDVGFQTVSWVFFSVTLSRGCEYFPCTRGLRAQ